MPTFVFFMRHRSQAFHTLLCLLSATLLLSGERGECRCTWCACAAVPDVLVLVRFDARWCDGGLVDLDDFECTLLVDDDDDDDLACSSVGGLGRLCSDFMVSMCLGAF